MSFPALGIVSLQSREREVLRYPAEHKVRPESGFTRECSLLVHAGKKARLVASTYVNSRA